MFVHGLHESRFSVPYGISTCTLTQVTFWKLIVCMIVSDRCLTPHVGFSFIENIQVSAELQCWVWVRTCTCTHARTHTCPFGPHYTLGQSISETCPISSCVCEGGALIVETRLADLCRRMGHWCRSEWLCSRRETLRAQENRESRTAHTRPPPISFSLFLPLSDVFWFHLLPRLWSRIKVHWVWSRKEAHTHHSHL